MSEFLEGKAEELGREISALLDPSASEDPLRWGDVWPLLTSPGDEASGIRLIIESVLRVAAGYKFWFLQPLESWHMQLLRFVSSPAGVVDDEAEDSNHDVREGRVLLEGSAQRHRSEGQKHIQI